jgi:hypothetical protein
MSDRNDYNHEQHDSEHWGDRSQQSGLTQQIASAAMRALDGGVEEFKGECPSCRSPKPLTGTVKQPTDGGYEPGLTVAANSQCSACGWWGQWVVTDRPESVNVRLQQWGWVAE